MDTKKCGVCHLIKPVTEFNLRYKKKSLTTRRYNCKKCCVEISKLKYKSRGYNKEKTYAHHKKYLESRKTDLNVFVRLKYRSMKNRVNHKNKKRFGSYNNATLCSKKEFIDMAVNSERLKTLYKEWQESGYQLQLVPSVDRIVNEKGYAIDNIQFITFNENTKKQ